LGRATTRSLERVAAAVGVLDGAPIEFERVADVPDGGVLFGLPALLLYGLLDRSREIFSMPEGFYPLESIFLLLALMALARIPSLEALRYVAPGEWGRLIGLDRIPEVRTLRQKVSALCSERGRAERWSGMLAKQWMESETQSAGVFYADGTSRTHRSLESRTPLSANCMLTSSPLTRLNLFLIQPASSTRLGAGSIVRSGVKTHCSALNWSKALICGSFTRLPVA